MLERVAHVQGAGDVGWWYGNRERGAVTLWGKIVVLLPGFVPGLFDILWLVFILYFTSPNWDMPVSGSNQILPEADVSQCRPVLLIP